jgi:hypothetical protein
MEPTMPNFFAPALPRRLGQITLVCAAIVAASALQCPQGLAAPADAKGKPPGDSRASLAARLMQTAPYRVEVATTDGSKLQITNGLTLERRRLLEKPGIAALAFSPDGAWLYAVTQSGEAWAVDPDAGKTVLVGKAPVGQGERVVDAVGLGPMDQLAVQVVIAKGSSPKGCAMWAAPRRVILRKPADGSSTARIEAREGWPEDRRTPRLSAISPNTRIKAAVIGPILQAEGRFGAPSGQISRSSLPAGTYAVEWMRDSAGVAAYYPRAPASGCKYRVGMRVFRSDEGKGWAEWTLPDSVDLLRGDQAWQDAEAAPDGMRWLATDPRGVLLVEPLPRFRGKLALIAPPSVAAPKLRPGVRALPSLVGGAVRLAELLMETGDLDAAEAEIAAQEGRASAAELAPLRSRLAKLQDTRARRAAELGLSLDDVRSAKGTPVGPAKPATPPDSEAVEPAAIVTPTSAPLGEANPPKPAAAESPAKLP